MNAKQLAKVIWFKHRTGCGDSEAEQFLKQAKFKLEEAIKLRRDHQDRLYRARAAVDDIVTPDRFKS